MDALHTVVGTLSRCKDACTHHTRWRAIWISALAAVTVPAGSVLATGMVVRAQAPASGARTQAPANAGDPSITVHLGGVRAGDSTTVDAGPDGSVFSATPVVGSPETAAPGQCTIGENGSEPGSGTCTITDLTTGVAYNVTETFAPAGWYDNPTLNVGTGGSVTHPVPYEFQTPELEANQNFTVPTDGNQVSFSGGAGPAFTDSKPPANPPTGPATPDTFSSQLAKSKNNPPAPTECGLNIALVLDQSSSITEPLQTELKRGATAAVNALIGTPSHLTIFTFGTGASVLQETTSTETAQSAEPLINAINGLPTAVGGGQFTDYDAAFNAVANHGGFEQVIFVTDGAPTASRLRPSNMPVQTLITDTEQGIFSANRVKNEGAHIIGLGIGLGDSGGLENLRAVTGPEEDTDFFATAPVGFGDLISTLVSGACASTLTITKQVQDASGALLANSSLANGFEFTSTIGTGSTGTNPTIESPVTSAEVAGDNGIAEAELLGLPPNATAPVTVVGTPRAGFTPVSAECFVNAVPQTTTFDVGTDRASFNAVGGATNTCLFVNRQVAAQTLELHVAKEANPHPTYTPGGTLTYTLTVSNRGNTAAEGALVNDALPAQLRTANPPFTWTCAQTTGSPGTSTCPAMGTGALANVMVDLAAEGGSVTFTVTGTVPATTTGDLVNDVTVQPSEEQAGLDEGCQPVAGNRCFATVTNTMVSPSPSPSPSPAPPTATPTVPPVVPPTAAPATPGLPITGIGHAVTGMVGPGLAALGGLALLLLLFIGQWGWRRRRNQG